MKTITVKQITDAINVSDNLARKYLRGANKPSYENMIILNKKLKIPFTAWIDIVSYLNGSKKSDDKAIINE